MPNMPIELIASRTISSQLVIRRMMLNRIKAKAALLNARPR